MVRGSSYIESSMVSVRLNTIWSLELETTERVADDLYFLSIARQYALSNG